MTTGQLVRRIVGDTALIGYHEWSAYPVYIPIQCVDIHSGKVIDNATLTCETRTLMNWAQQKGVIGEEPVLWLSSKVVINYQGLDKNNAAIDSSELDRTIQVRASAPDYEDKCETVRIIGNLNVGGMVVLRMVQKRTPAKQ